MAGNMLSVEEASAELGISRATVWNWIRRNRITTFRVVGERRTLIRREDVERMREPVPIEEPRKLRRLGSSQRRRNPWYG